MNDIPAQYLRSTLRRRSPSGCGFAQSTDRRARRGSGVCCGARRCGSFGRYECFGRRHSPGGSFGLGRRRSRRWCRQINYTDIAPAVAIYAVRADRVIPDDVGEGRRGEHGFQQISVAHVRTLEARATQVRIEEVCTDERHVTQINRFEVTIREVCV